jgi:nicotinate-nucleotide adenylyltransferase
VQKIGIFGGTFDPPHLAHLSLTELAAQRLDLDLVYFIPTFNHPLKDNMEISPIEVRFEMMAAAIRDYPKFRVSSIEVDRGEISYTVDTLRDFARYEKLNKAQLYLILGSDNINEFHLWKDPDQIFKMAQVVVLRRPGSLQQSGLDTYKNEIVFLDLPLMDISSTEIREKIACRQMYRDLVPAGVAKIIEKYELYR